ncbi:MAG: nidogen-like domain-containing protein [Bacteroidota bacterium]
MKKILPLLLQLIVLLVSAADNKNGSITVHSTADAVVIISDPVKINEADPCNCWIERDGTWNVVPFDGSGGGGGPGLPPEYRNDDWSTAPFVIPFDFCFYGTTYHEIYINNNGNVSFDAPYSTFSADSFPSSTFKMIAPFWADFDSRGLLSGVTYYKLTATSLILQWDHVGYYGTHDDKLNTFQLILTDGFDPILDAGKNVSFCYRDMQWTTGDASGGINGFSGTPATVGANLGDGISSIQIGRFDQPLASYSGPYGGGAGVDFLDNQSYTFGLCNSSNVAPFLKYSGLCDTLEICIGDTTIVDFEFYSPELSQTTTTAFNFFGLSDCGVLQNSPGNVAATSCYIAGTAGNAGYHSISVTATDNGSPQQSTTALFVVHIKNADATFTYSPSPALLNDTVVFTANSTDNTYAVWNFGDGSPADTGNVVTHIFNIAALFNVTLNAINEGCTGTESSTQQVTVMFVGVDENSSDLQVSLSPNPSNGVLLFNAKDDSKKYSLEIIDIQGRIVFNDFNLSANHFIDINNLENGAYFYKISNNNGQVKGQFFKQ